MSLFRKPKKIQRRVFCADDEEDGDPEPPSPPIISQETKAKKDKSLKKPTLLSFADEEEECEEFKVKKSSQSKRLAKKREKEKKRVPDNDSNKNESTNHEDNNGNHAETNTIRETGKTKKRVTLEGLILSGREALAADGAGDMSDSGDEESGEEDARGFHQYRAESVRAALATCVAPGHIPDAALIHAARKTRQQARELGDFVPIQTEPREGSRLVREGDDSADDDEDRIHVRGLDLPSDKPKRGTAAVASDEEMNSEVEEWEEQQIKKAMPAIVDLTGDGMEMNPFAVAPPPPRLDAAPAHLRPLALGSAQAPASADQLVQALSTRLSELRTQRQETAFRRDEVSFNLLTAARVREKCAGKRGELAAAYKHAQAIRGYLTDLIECLDEKLPQLEALEARALALARRRCEYLVERRRADVRDQAQDVLALGGRPGAGAGATKPAESEEKTRRVAEREGRRRARRLQRAAHLHHLDGDSSDDELPPAEQHHYLNERASIKSESAALFADALGAWRGVRGVCARLAAWRRRDHAAYADTHLPAALPRLIAPYVRHQLIMWNPLADEDNEDYEKMDWYKCLMMYGVKEERVEDESSSSSEPEEESGAAGGAGGGRGAGAASRAYSEEAVRTDVDLMLVPNILNKVVLPKVTELVEHAWDPMCVRACIRLRGVLVRAASVPAGRPALARLAAAVKARLTTALAADVFLPALPPQIIEGGGGAFWRRCVGSGARLLRATLALTAPPAVLHADLLVLKLIDTLRVGAGAAAGPAAASAALALAETLPRAPGTLRRAALQRLSALAALALQRLQTDNPLHLKALEQARAVIAEAKAME